MVNCNEIDQWLKEKEKHQTKKTAVNVRIQSSRWIRFPNPSLYVRDSLKKLCYYTNQGRQKCTILVTLELSDAQSTFLMKWFVEHNKMIRWTQQMWPFRVKGQSSAMLLKLIIFTSYHFFLPSIAYLPLHVPRQKHFYMYVS